MTSRVAIQLVQCVECKRMVDSRRVVWITPGSPACVKCHSELHDSYAQERNEIEEITFVPTPAELRRAIEELHAKRMRKPKVAAPPRVNTHRDSARRLDGRVVRKAVGGT